MDDEDFTIPYVIDTIPNSPTVHQLPKQANKNIFIIAINEEDRITAQGAPDELNYNQTQHGKYEVKISLFISKS